MNILKTSQAHDLTPYRPADRGLNSRESYNDILFGLLRLELPQDKPKPVYPASTVRLTGVDILIPCYQHGDRILAVVRSCLKQTVQPSSIHILLMDADSQALFAELEELAPGKVYCHIHSQLAPSAARNLLATFASNSHLVFLDADDPLNDSSILELLLKYKDYDIVMPCWRLNSSYVEFASIYNTIYCSQTTSLLRRDFFERTRFDETFVNGAEDTEFFLRAYLQGARIRYSLAPFERSGARRASFTTFERYGSYDLIRKHWSALKPLIQETYNKELDAFSLSRLYYLQKLMNDDLSYLQSFQELEGSRSKHALWFARTTSAGHSTRQAFAQACGKLAQLTYLNKLDNVACSARFIKKSSIACPNVGADISVVIPCYRQSHLVEHAVNSVLQQTQQQLVREILVLLMDEKSRDLTATLELKDPRVHCICRERLWLPAARNYLIRRTSGAYILPVDADDQLKLDFLEKLMPYMIDHDVVLTDIDRNDGTNSTGYYEHTDVDNIFDFPVAHPTAIISRSFIDRCLQGRAYDELFNTGFEDHDFWIRCALYGRLKYVREPLICYRPEDAQRQPGETSYLSMAVINANNYEMLIKYKDIYRAYALQCTLSSNSLVVTAAQRLLAELDSILIKEEDLR